KTLTIVELIGGIGALRKALHHQEIPHKLIDDVEIDRNCVKSYKVLYNENFITQSVKGYSLPNMQIDMLMHGSPCQDFS
ncbi:DNA cytosine methyltransferase, partial [Streptococcus suis]